MGWLVVRCPACGVVHKVVAGCSPLCDECRDKGRMVL